MSEITSCTMHNLQTPRGAKARDALLWAGYLTEALALYGDRAEILTTGHCRPRFGKEEVTDHLSIQRDNYKFVHDQTVRLMNQGATPLEIAEILEPPKAVADEWSTNGYYGTYRHNAKGVFQYYIGWWDGIPAHLNRPMLEGVETDVQISGSSLHFKELFLQRLPIAELQGQGLSFSGNPEAVARLQSVTEPPSPDFPVVTPD